MCLLLRYHLIIGCGLYVYIRHLRKYTLTVACQLSYLVWEGGPQKSVHNLKWLHTSGFLNPNRFVKREVPQTV